MADYISIPLIAKNKQIEKSKNGWEFILSRCGKISESQAKEVKMIIELCFES